MTWTRHSDTVPRPSQRLYLEDGARYRIALVAGRVIMSVTWHEASLSFCVCSKSRVAITVDEVTAVDEFRDYRTKFASVRGAEDLRWTPIGRCYLARHAPAPPAPKRRKVSVPKPRPPRPVKDAGGPPLVWMHPYSRLTRTLSASAGSF